MGKHNVGKLDVPLGMVRIPAGKFVMGTESVRVKGEPFTEPHEVMISRSFYIDERKVTTGEFNTIMSTVNGWTCEDCPVAVTWAEADSYCKALGQRLPTEAEWEYVARGEGHNLLYPSRDGQMLAPLEEAGCRGEREDVCAYRGNYVLWGGLEVCDLTSKDFQWVSDWSGDYPKGPVKDPTGPETGTKKIVRGGCFVDTSINFYDSTMREDRPVEDQASFRCVMDIPNSSSNGKRTERP